VPKLKTHKGTAKRFKLTGSGKLMRTKGEKRHLRRNRSKRAKRGSWKMIEMTTSGQVKRIGRLAPYLGKFKG
jgi:large subunit ribosomal protein L35